MMNKYTNREEGKANKGKAILAAILSLVLAISMVTISPATSYAAQKKTIAASAVSVTKSVSYTGKAVKPTVTVKISGKALKVNQDYTVKYKDNIKVGTATVTVKGKGKYTGTVKKTFTIVPKAISLEKYALNGTTVSPEWKVINNDVTGYQVRYSTDKTMEKNAKTVTVKGASQKTAAVKNLKENTTYYFQVRAYKTVSGKNFYSKWNGAKTGKILAVKTGNNQPAHVCHFVEKTHTEDHGYYREIYENHVICNKCREIIDNLTAREILEKHNHGEKQVPLQVESICMGEEWVSVPTEVVEYYYCPECGKKQPA